MSSVVRLPVPSRPVQAIEQGADDGALRYAMRDLAAFKFKLIETIAADPLLQSDPKLKAPCTAAMVAMLTFVTVDRRTLKRTDAYASLITLMVRGGIKETAAKVARRILVKHGYLVDTGKKTKDGCTRYRVENPHAERVDMHVKEAAEYLKERAAVRRKEERQKGPRMSHPSDVVAEYAPAQMACGGVRQCDVVAEYAPKYLRGYLSDISSEQEASTGEGNEPFPVPDTEDDATAFLQGLNPDGRLSPGVMRYFHTALMAGKLTPAMVEQQRDFVS